MGIDSSEDNRILDEKYTNEQKISSAQEDGYLSAFSTIKRVASRKLGLSYRDYIEDITQKVMSKLWNWRSNKNGHDLTEKEWEKLAYTATQNEIKTFYTQKLHKEVPLVVDSENNAEGTLSDNHPSFKIEGNTQAEVRSLLVVVWQNIQKLSLRQRYSILLHSQELITYLVSNKCCTIKEIADSLEMDIEEFAAVAGSLPIADVEICTLLNERIDGSITIKQLWEARGKGKVRMYAELKKVGIR
jgi:DNA-directed RNA polymerase specialized sigma24 family protein